MIIISNIDFLQNKIPFLKDRIQLNYGEESPIQNHADSEIWEIHEGIGILLSEGEKTIVKAGNIIVFNPLDSHYIKNINDTPLIFTTYWYLDEKEFEASLNAKLTSSKDSVLICSSFPTPNGELHLGHISGSVLPTYIAAKYCELMGKKALIYSGTFGYTNHIERTASGLNILPEQLVSNSTNKIIESFNLIGLKTDYFMDYHEWENNRNECNVIVTKLFNKLKSSGKLFEKQVYHPFDPVKNEFICESYVSGNCPNCNYLTIAYECENCGLFQDECKIINPFYSETKQKLELKKITRPYVKIEEEFLHLFSLKLYENNSHGAHILHQALKIYHSKGLLSDIPLTTFRKEGVIVENNLVLSMPIDRAFSDYYSLNQMNLKGYKEHIAFRGSDNLCASGILAPYILYLIDIPMEYLPVTIPSCFYLLEDKKFSTSRNHVIWFLDFAKKYHIGFIRYYMAKTYGAISSKNFSYSSFKETTAQLKSELLYIITWAQKLLNQLGVKELEAGQFTAEDMIFYKEIKTNCDLALNYCSKYNYSNYIFKIEAMLGAIAQYINDAKLNKVQYNQRTRVYLILYSLKMLAIIAYPLLTEISLHLLKSLNSYILDRSFSVFKNVTFTKSINFIEDL